MSWQIKKQDIPLLAIGAKILSCGGGGNTKTVQNLLMSIMSDEDAIVVKTISDLVDERVVAVGIMGSTILYDEHIPSGREGVQVLEVYESTHGTKVDALIPIEIGGVNALTPLVTAVLKNLPVVDGDGMGRAYPELSMTTFHLSGIPVAPLVLQTDDENMFIEDVDTIQSTTELAKDFMVRNEGFAHLLCFAANARKIKTSMIPGSLKLIHRLGVAVKKDTLKSQKIEEISAVFENSIYGKPNLVISGVVSGVNRWFEKGSLVGRLIVEGRFSSSNKRIEIEFKNEFISIKEEEQYVCTTPDLILVLNEENLLPYNVSEIQAGHSVIVFAVQAPNILRTKEMLELVGPENFDLAVSYKSLPGEFDYETRY
ncbi:DUF917 domain-containing protein [Bacillus canaveralius]|uniref:DUF917 domain-containing protein n=1 Tax=Bacillus canaveralius TaxID=1403243 RepID=A0A2N5GGR8_9BACI|nr:DUF917 family protein [Bacillus canaveralius]PLR79936.1 DUF917 domain-containing protein [Bacillus canaveralius]PLR88445.1 DUF917 domain-containing protein [Bacillus canaveralius]